MPQRYKFGAPIGSGGFGVVSHATRLEDGSPFAVKHLAEALTQDEDAVRRFRREVRLQRSLEHPNVLPILGYNLSVTPPWFIMPIAERTLLDEAQSDLRDADIHRLFRSILDGVQYAHSRGVIHRDLKPENVLLTHDGIPQVADFGLGKNLLSDSIVVTQTTVGMGSFPYVAPEQMLDMRDADARADVYALGKILQYLVTRQVPVAPVDKVELGVYRYFISKCCEFSRDERYQDVVEARSAFEMVANGVLRPEPPRETVRTLLEHKKELSSAQERELLEVFDAEPDDELLHTRWLPELPESVIRRYLAHEKPRFREVLKAYDRAVSPRGGLDWDYCDVVADFYRVVYRNTDDLSLQKMLLRRLIEMGASHNRYHVGSVVAGILAGIRTTDEVMMAADVLNEHKDDAEWLRPNAVLRGADLAIPIDEAIFG